MPEVTRRRTGEFMRHLFAILVDHPEGMQAGDAITAVRKRVKLTDYESGAYPSGGERFEKILRFATVDTVKAGWLEKRKGWWIVRNPRCSVSSVRSMAAGLSKSGKPAG